MFTRNKLVLFAQLLILFSNAEQLCIKDLQKNVVK